MHRLTTPRITGIDVLRGFAMVWMTCYHFCFDLHYFGWINQDFYNNPIWTWQRSAIVSLFLFCVGLSQAAASDTGRFAWRRWSQIVGCAALVTAGSYAMYPNSYIYFGVLHSIAVMLLLLFIAKPLGQWLWLIGGLCLVVFAIQTRQPFVVWNAAPWNSLGLITQKPMTEDYVPLLPWFALVCGGYALGLKTLKVEKTSEKKGLNALFNPFIVRCLAQLGQYSLVYYVLHQPVLIGLCYLAKCLLDASRLA